MSPTVLPERLISPEGPFRKTLENFADPASAWVSLQREANDGWSERVERRQWWLGCGGEEFN